LDTSLTAVAEARIIVVALRGAEGAALPRQWTCSWRPLPQRLKPGSFLARLCGTLRLCSGQALEAVPFPVEIKVKVKIKIKFKTKGQNKNQNQRQAD
jgi:hypothetical protein